jgi:hypothetical protein
MGKITGVLQAEQAVEAGLKKSVDVAVGMGRTEMDLQGWL